MSVRLRLASTVAAVTLLLAGCSSSSSGSASSTTTSPATAAVTSVAAQPSSAPTAQTSAGASTGATSASGSAAVAASGPATASALSSGPAAQDSPTPASGSAAGDATAVFGASASPDDCIHVSAASLAIGEAIDGPVVLSKTGPDPFEAQALIKAATDGEKSVPAELVPDFALFEKDGQQLVGKDLTTAGALLKGPEFTNALAEVNKFITDRC